MTYVADLPTLGRRAMHLKGNSGVHVALAAPVAVHGKEQRALEFFGC